MFYVMLKRLLVCTLIVLIVTSLGRAAATSNTVPASGATEHIEPITANDLTPSYCSHLTLSNIVLGGAVISGTGSADLILGDDGINTIIGFGGADCIVAGDGADIIDGDDGNDVIDGGQGIDVCVGGLGNDTFYNCEP